jgi:Predicted transcriptional regulators
MSIFGDRLKELRANKNVTQKQMAETLGITEQAYQKYEYAMREPNHETTVKLAMYFSVSTDYLLGLSDNL